MHGKQLLIIDNPSDKVKSEEVVSAKHLLNVSNKACLKKTQTVQIINPVTGTDRMLQMTMV